MKIQTNKENRFGRKVRIAKIVAVFDAKGIAEVTDAEAAVLLKADISLSEVGKKKKVADVSEEVSVTDNTSKANAEVEDEVTEDSADPKEAMQELSLKDLKELATAAKLPKSEWKKMTKDNLIDYLIDHKVGLPESE